jgi:predicted aldo/keto reductase-like oxidoreductase
MIYNEYGKTGIELSAIGFGGMRFTDQKDVDGCAALVQEAYAKDINYFDTAPGYGKSEEIFGVAFKDMQKTRAEKPFYVSTKSNKANPEMLRKDLETSLTRMGIDYIDFYHMWCVMSLDAYESRKRKGVLKELERMRDEGLVRHICVSTHMRGEDTATMLNDYGFEGILLGYSAMNFAYRDAGVSAAADLNMGVTVMNPLGGGVIPDHPDRFSFVKTRDDETVVQGALRFLIADPRITVALVGLGSHEHLDEAISAVDGYQEISAEAIQSMRAGLNESFDSLCSSCRYCDDCPQKISVPELMEAYNHFHLTGDGGTLVDRLHWHWGMEPEKLRTADCTECGSCENACTQKLPIIERLKEIQTETAKVIAEREAKKNA